MHIPTIIATVNALCSEIHCKVFPNRTSFFTVLPYIIISSIYGIGSGSIVLSNNNGICIGNGNTQYIPIPIMYKNNNTFLSPSL